MTILKALVFLSVFASVGSSSFSTEKVNDVFTKCFDTPLGGEDPLRPECTKAFMQFAIDMKKNVNFTKEKINYLWSLEREIQQKVFNHRHKRQAAFLPIRRECRLMGEVERWRLFRAVNRIKRELFINDSSVYDTIADLHFGLTVDVHIHIGSNFLGWHRVYLLVYEFALRRAVPGVNLCFWDTTMENRLGREVWAQSAVFSNEFFGNGRGQVVTGPFRNWTVPEFEQFNNSRILVRALDRFGSPVNIRAANLMFYGSNSLSHEQVCVIGSGQDLIIVDGFDRNVTIEREHDFVHIWIGGIMSRTDSSPYDPIFWFHHTYIDYMWELFRQKMRRFGRDPTTDYPANGRNETLSAPDYRMIHFQAFRNIDGYSDFFTQFFYRYESPNCQACFQSPWTICDNFGQCVARINMPGTELVEGPTPTSPMQVAAFGFAGAARNWGGRSAGRRFPLTNEEM